MRHFFDSEWIAANRAFQHISNEQRRSRLDKILYACDELCGFLTACAIVRPERLVGLSAKSVRIRFAVTVNRSDITNGVVEFDAVPDEHIEFRANMAKIANDLGLSVG